MPNRLGDGARFETAIAHRRTGIPFIGRYIPVKLSRIVCPLSAQQVLQPAIQPGILLYCYP